jgi:Uncharacterized distant relative of cell wall-associated hydrolases
MRDMAGQFGVVRSSGFYSDGIRFFQHLQDRKDQLWQYTHSFIAIDNTTLVEAWPGGARTAPISEYDHILWSHQDLTEVQRAGIVKFATDHVGDAYAWEDIPLIAIALATGRHTPAWLEQKIANPHRWICSAFVDAAYQSAGKHLFHNVPPSAVFPAMLASLIASGRPESDRSEPASTR